MSMSLRATSKRSADDRIESRGIALLIQMVLKAIEEVSQLQQASYSCFEFGAEPLVVAWQEYAPRRNAFASACARSHSVMLAEFRDYRARQ
jgi:hypothetical protein